MSQPSDVIKFSKAVNTSSSNSNNPQEKNLSSLTKRIPKALLENAMPFLTGREICLVSRVDIDMRNIASSDRVWTAVSRNALGLPRGNSVSKWEALRLFMHANQFGDELRKKALLLKAGGRWNDYAVACGNIPKKTDPFDHFADIRSFLFNKEFSLLEAIDFPPSSISFQTKEEVIKILLERQKPTTKELLAAMSLCKQGLEEETMFQKKREFALRLIPLLIEKGALVNTEVLNKALEFKCPKELIELLFKLGAEPDETTLSIALTHMPESVPLLLQKNVKPSQNSLGLTFAAWGKKGIDDAALEQLLKMHLEPKEAVVSLDALKQAVQAKIPLITLKPLIDIATKGLSQDNEVELYSELLVAALELGPTERNESSWIVLDYFMNKVDHPTTLHINSALVNGHPITILKSLFVKGARFDQTSFQRALRGHPTEEVVDFLIENEAPFQIQEGVPDSSPLANLPLPILRKILPLVRQTNEYDVIEALRNKLPIDIVKKICSLCNPLPASVLDFALENGLKEVVALLVKEFGLQMVKRSRHGLNTYINSFNVALKYSADSEWIKFVKGLGACPEGSDPDDIRGDNSYTFAVQKEASDEVLDDLESQGIGPSDSTFVKAIEANASLRILKRLIKKQARLKSTCWFCPSAFSSLERFKLLYDYAKSRHVPQFDQAIREQAPLEVLEFLLKENIRPTMRSFGLAWQNLGLMPDDELRDILVKLLSLKLRLDVGSLHGMINKLKAITRENIEYMLNHGTIRESATFGLLFSKDLSQDAFEILIKIYLQMRNFSSPAEDLVFDAKHNIYVPVFPKTVAETLESKTPK